MSFSTTGMDISLKQFKNEHQQKFDVLNKQLGDDYHGYRIPIRFEDVRKPTELEPLPPAVGSKSYKAPATIAEEAPKVQEEINSLAKTEIETSEKFTPPKSFSDYVKNLIASGKKQFRILPFDMEDAKSEEEVKTILKKEVEEGVINDEQKKEMENLLSDSARAKQERLLNLKNNHGIIIG